MTSTFDELGLPATVLSAIKKIGFVTPTPIQAQAIPHALKGHDVLGSAQTGTGKTAAFGIPMVVQLLANPDAKGIVMTPTRELAAQVLATLEPLLLGSRIRTALLIGGESMQKQLKQLSLHPRVIVGTPGRINDHLERKSVNLSNAHYLVLDETDRMLDMGFGVQIDRILKHMPKERQTLLFSATIPPEIEKMAQKYQKNPARIAVGDVNKVAANIKQELLRLSDGDKYPALLDQLETRKGSIIVFVKTKFGAKRMAEKLVKGGIKADAIHGNLNQNKRDRVIQAFRDKKYRVLVATDVAARGLDIPHIEHVINYDLPQSPEDYIHRIGRTARAGAEGAAIAFITPSENRLWQAIQRLMNPGEKIEGGREERGARAPQKRGGNSRFGGERRNSERRNDGPRGGERRSFGGRRDDERASDTRRDDERASDTRRDDNRSFDKRRDDNRPSEGRRDDSRSFAKRRDDSRPSEGRHNDNRRDFSRQVTDAGAADDSIYGGARKPRSATRYKSKPRPDGTPGFSRDNRRKSRKYASR